MAWLLREWCWSAIQIRNIKGYLARTRAQESGGLRQVLVEVSAHVEGVPRGDGGSYGDKRL